MNLLDRYIASVILKGVASVVLVLLAVVTAVEFVGQLDDIGTAQYRMSDAFAYVALRIPRSILQMLPAAALLGALLSLGNLAVQAVGNNDFPVLTAVVLLFVIMWVVTNFLTDIAYALVDPRIKYG